MSRSLFIIGANRSGTKWLSNLISNHREVISVQREGAGGILEVNFFQFYPESFDLEDQESRTAFEILYHRSNFYKCCQVSLQDAKVTESDDWSVIFSKLMDTYAEKNGVSKWLQKAGSFTLEDIVQHFPDAKIIIISRENIIENVISNILLTEENIRLISVLKFLFVYYYSRKTEKRYKNNANVSFVTYESLKDKTLSTVKKVCEHFELNYEKGMELSVYKPNTSFKKVDRNDYYTFSNKLKIYSLSWFFNLMPFFLFKGVHKTKTFISSPKSISFMPNTFSIYREEIKK